MKHSAHLDKTLFLTFDPRTGILQTSLVSLTIISPQGSRETITLEAEALPLRIGSGKSNDIVLTDPYVSNHHCELNFHAGRVFVHDIKSTNGTRINNVPISSATPLHSGDEIELGKSILLFKISRKAEKILAPGKKSQPEFEGILSANDQMQRIFNLIEKIAPSQETLLITGETGTGKELVARAIHRRSKVRGPFFAINCSAIAPNLVESELFGHVRGAFTGAEKSRMGAFELASHGTLFLDEIAELPLPLQSKLLRAIEYKEIRPVGGESVKNVNVRIIAATHKDLREEVKLGTFREDLFYRLFVLHLHLPPLRERKEDIGLLARHFVEAFNPSISITDRSYRKLENHAWPGNVRELQHVVKRTLLSIDSKSIDSSDWRFTHYSEPAEVISDEASLEEIERFYILKTFQRCNGSKKETARILGLAHSTLHDKLKKYALID